MRLDNIEKKKELEDKKEIFKVQLRTFVERLGNSAFGESALLPNCIMLLCEDKEVVYEVANWLKEVSSVTDFQYIQGKYNDLNLMQDKLISTLEEAEKNYQ